MSALVSVVKLATWNVQKSVTKSQTSSWNIGLPVQTNMTQMASVPWISAYPS